MIASLVLIASAVITFSGYVPPHAAADGVRYRVAASAVDMPAAMQACGIKDFKPVRAGGADTYDFAVTRATVAEAECLRTRLPAGARLAPLDHWETDAEAY